MISFVIAQGSLEIRLACSKILLLITLIADSEILLRTHLIGYIKGNTYFFFVKVDAENVLLTSNYL